MLRRSRSTLNLRPRPTTPTLSIIQRWRIVAASTNQARNFRTSRPLREEDTTQPKSDVDNAKTTPPRWTLDRQAVDRQLKDIVTEDLAATLKAHKLSNAETRFRWVARDDDDETSAVEKQETLSVSPDSALEQDLTITEDTELETQDNQNKQWRYTRGPNAKEPKKEPAYVAPKRYGEHDYTPFWPVGGHETRNPLSRQAQCVGDLSKTYSLTLLILPTDFRESCTTCRIGYSSPSRKRIIVGHWPVI